MKRPLYVQQNENRFYGDRLDTYWYVVKSPNGQALTTSEMYHSRSNAKRAARAFIRAINPVQVEFTYWTGRVGQMECRRQLIR